MTATADFELGTNGASLSISDPGSLTAWSGVTIVGGGIIRYSNTQAAHGALSCYMQGDNVTGAGNAGWNTSTLTDWWGRIYFFPTGVITDTADRIVAVSGAGGFSCGVQFETTRAVSLINASFIQAATSSTLLTLNQWARIEFHFVHGSGVASCLIYTSLDSATPAETFGATDSFGTNMTSVQFGQSDSSSTSGFYYDQLALGASSQVGPFPVNSVAPTVSGSAPVGSVLTAANGTWNGTFNFAYQWTRDGVNIGGATGATYTSQSADATHAVGVKVTATGQQATNESATSASSNTISVTAATASIFGPPPLLGRMGR